MSTTGKIWIVYNLLWCFHEYLHVKMSEIVPLNTHSHMNSAYSELKVSKTCFTYRRSNLSSSCIHSYSFPSSINTSLEREGLPSGDEEEGDSVSHWHAQWDCWIRREQWDPPSGTPSIIIVIIIIPGLVGAHVCSSELKSRQTSQNVTVNVTYMGLVDIKGF